MWWWILWFAYCCWFVLFTMSLRWRSLRFYDRTMYILSVCMHNLIVFNRIFFILSIFLLTFSGNTEGWRCERCKAGYWGDADNGCELCRCHEAGSLSQVCDGISGQCLCAKRYTGHQCDECDVSIYCKVRIYLVLLFCGYILFVLFVRLTKN